MKNQDKQDKKVIIVAVLALAAGLLWGASLNPPRASASLFSDFWSGLAKSLNPLKLDKTEGEAPGAASPVSPYRPAADYENAVVSAVKQASQAVVSITISANVPVLENCSYNPFQDLPPEFQQFFGANGGGFDVPCKTGKTQFKQIGGGSGFIISPDGLILTNKHVVSNASATYSVITNDGKTYDARVLARDPVQDIAILKIAASGLPTVALGDSNNLQLGQTAIAIGNALGQFSNTVSVGVVSGLGRTVTAGEPVTGAEETIQGVIQTDAAINPGNSGGPLLNLQGQVIGINTAVASNAQNVGFAIPVDQAKRDIVSVEKSGEIQAPYLGVRYTLVTPAFAQKEKLPVGHGALVRGDGSSPGVQPGSPAARAGIQEGDVIIKLDGQDIDAVHDLISLVNQHAIGDTLALVINRGGNEMAVPVTLARRPPGT